MHSDRGWQIEACGVNEIAPVIRRDGWEGEQHVMQSRSIRRSGQPISASASQNAGFDRNPIPARRSDVSF
jgi:hypothetical protein